MTNPWYIPAFVAALLAIGCTSKRDAAPGDPAPSAVPAASVPIHVAVKPDPPRPAAPAGQRCREQPAQDFLLRRDQIAKIGAPASEVRLIEAARKRSIDYRTREYGRFPGFGSRRDNPHPPIFYAERTTFMGLPVTLNRKVVPALQCVEAALRRDCAAEPYQPKRVGGLRSANTYKDYEVSNHVYGIAIDVDPDLNPCCHCVGKWPDSSACKKKVGSIYERMVMPKCWVEVFERYGFHWLGHDELGDTMHFEFLGDPERVHD